ncbi:hypothetical protein DW094_00755 [Ruminococcaceae bacterium AM07-15]|nr:hypothetical protein DW094_00755 [Ruminococcaceae bacterium AM07-15]
MVPLFYGHPPKRRKKRQNTMYILYPARDGVKKGNRCKSALRRFFAQGGGKSKKMPPGHRTAQTVEKPIWLERRFAFLLINL